MKKTQIEEVKKYLEKHKKGITSLEAIERFGATRLSGIIWKLRNKYGMNIVVDRKNVVTRYGTTSSVAVYRLDDGTIREA